MDLPRASPAKNPSSAVLKAKSNYSKKKYSPGGSGKGKMSWKQQFKLYGQW
jgi:hypothetical protein